MFGEAARGGETLLGKLSFVFGEAVREGVGERERDLGDIKES